MKAFRLFNPLIFVLFSLIQVNCTTTKTQEQKNETGLSNTTWELSGINNKQVMTASMGDGMHLTFEPFENRISGFGGCNRYFGNYRLGESGSLQFDAIGSTKMMCPNLSTETEFLNAIRQVNLYKINGQTLELYQNETRLATFTKIPYRK